MKLKTYFEIAHAVASESKCASMAVGCVIVKDDRVIGSGYNGTVRGDVNCCEVWEGRSLEHSAWSQKREIHSEMNALANCETSTQGTTAITTVSPCFNCTKHLIAFGVTRIIFEKKYDNYPTGEWEEILNFCEKVNVTIMDGGYREGKRKETKLKQLGSKTRKVVQRCNCAGRPQEVI